MHTIQERVYKKRIGTHIPILKCPEQDSNLHVLANTTPSKWRVYQFHHLGFKSGDKGI